MAPRAWRSAPSGQLLSLGPAFLSAGDVRDRLCFQSAGVFLDAILVPIALIAEEDADVTHGDRPALPVLFDGPTALPNQPADVRRDRPGALLLERGLGDAVPAVGPGHREGDHRRLRPAAHAVALQVDRLRLHALLGDHRLPEGLVEEDVDAGHRAERAAKGDHGAAGLDDAVREPLVEPQIRATEAVDRLLRVADEEERPGRRRGLRPLGGLLRLAGQAPGDLHLHDVGVLHLVDEDMGEPGTQRAPRLGMVSQEGPRSQEQLEVVDGRALAHHPLVLLDQRAERLLELGSQLGPRALRPLPQLLSDRIAVGGHVLAIVGAEGPVVHVLVEPGLAAEHPPQAGVEPLHVVAQRGEVVPCGLPPEADAPDELVHRDEALPEVVPGLARRRVGRELGEPVDQPLHLLGVESALVALPGRRKVPVLDQVLSGRVEGAAGPLVARPGPLAQHPPDADGRVREHRLPVTVEGPIVERVTTVGGHEERGVEPCFEGQLSEDVRAEPVEGADVGRLDLSHRLLEASALGVVLAGSAGLLEPLPKAELHLAGRLLGEGQRGDLIETSVTGADERHQASDEGLGLAGAGRRLDEQAAIELLGDAPSRVGVDPALGGIGGAAHL